jgi:hypothetical protein
MSEWCITTHILVGKLLSKLLRKVDALKTQGRKLSIIQKSTLCLVQENFSSSSPFSGGGSSCANPSRVVWSPSLRDFRSLPGRRKRKGKQKKTNRPQEEAGQNQVESVLLMK